MRDENFFYKIFKDNTKSYSSHILPIDWWRVSQYTKSGPLDKYTIQTMAAYMLAEHAPKHVVQKALDFVSERTDGKGFIKDLVVGFINGYKAGNKLDWKDIKLIYELCHENIEINNESQESFQKVLDKFNSQIKL